VGDECGDAVVVAESDRVVGDRIVLVHDRQNVHLELLLKARAGSQVAGPVEEVRRGDEHLADPHVELAGDGVVGLHQLDLADRRQRLERREVAGPLIEFKVRHARSDRRR